MEFAGAAVYQAVDLPGVGLHLLKAVLELGLVILQWQAWFAVVVDELLICLEAELDLAVAVVLAASSLGGLTVWDSDV